MRDRSWGSEKLFTAKREKSSVSVFLPILTLTTFDDDDTRFGVRGSDDVSTDSTEFGLLKTLHCVTESSGVSKKFKSNSEWASNFTSVMSSGRSDIVELMFDDSIWNTSMMTLPNGTPNNYSLSSFTRFWIWKEVHRWEFIFKCTYKLIWFCCVVLLTFFA